MSLFTALYQLFSGTIEFTSSIKGIWGKIFEFLFLFVINLHFLLNNRKTNKNQFDQICFILEGKF